MKPTCRIILSETCNYNCSYCCNKFMRDKFVPLQLKDVHVTLAHYNLVVISGGEPLLPCHERQLSHCLTSALRLYLPVIVYTNLSSVPEYDLTETVSGWTCGFHPSQTTAREFADRVKQLKAMGAQSVRINVEDKHLISLSQFLPNEDLRPFIMNDCDRSDIEDIYILTP